MKVFLKWWSTLCVVLVLSSGAAFPQQQPASDAPLGSEANPFRTLDEVCSHDFAKTGDAQLHFDLEGVLTLFNGRGRGGFFSSDGQGIYITFNFRSGEISGLRAGDKLRVRGKVDPGYFLPHLEVDGFELTGHEALPEPVRITSENLFSPNQDSQRAVIDGLLLGVDYEKNPEMVVMTLRFSAYDIKVRLSRFSADINEIKKLIHKWVRVNGIAATRANARRQMTMRYIQIDEVSDIQPIYDDEGPAREPTHISRILSYGSDQRQPAYLQGPVLWASNSRAWVLDGDTAHLVWLRSDVDVEPGRDFWARGQPLISEFGPQLLAEEVRIGDAIESIEPMEWQWDGGDIPPSMEHQLVKFDADILSMKESDDDYVFQCRHMGHSFEAFLRKPADPPPTDSSVEMVGLMKLEKDALFRSGISMAEGFSLRLRSADDVVITRPPPYWTPERLTNALWLILAVLGALGMWAMSLRWRVAKQTRVITEQVEESAALRERQRLARRLHDNLQQDIVSVAMQLEHARDSVDAGDEASARSSISKADELIANCQDKTRGTIASLRASEAPRESLTLYFGDGMHERAEAEGAQLDIRTLGQARTFDPEITSEILFICGEAFENCLRHAKAKSIVITFDYRDEEIFHATVQDDGVGFRKDGVDTHRHFGLTGLRERAELLDAELDIISSPGKGTKIALSLEAPASA